MGQCNSEAHAIREETSRRQARIGHVETGRRTRCCVLPGPMGEAIDATFMAGAGHAFCPASCIAGNALLSKPSFFDAQISGKHSFVELLVFDPKSGSAQQTVHDPIEGGEFLPDMHLHIFA